MEITSNWWFVSIRSTAYIPRNVSSVTVKNRTDCEHSNSGTLHSFRLKISRSLEEETVFVHAPGPLEYNGITSNWQCISTGSTIYDSGKVSSGIPSSLSFVPLWEREIMTPRGMSLSVGGISRDQSCCRESAAFLNESIIREIITGRNLAPPVGHPDKTPC